LFGSLEAELKKSIETNNRENSFAKHKIRRNFTFILSLLQFLLSLKKKLLSLRVEMATEATGFAREASIAARPIDTVNSATKFAASMSQTHPLLFRILV
jgi:hypothetical protein